MPNRKINFNAGPAGLPESILAEAQEDLLNYQNSGLSVMEMSHRSSIFETILLDAKTRLQTLLNIPDEYDVLFLQGGASLQFAMIPLNLCHQEKNTPVQYINSGSWTKKAIAEVKTIKSPDIIADSESHNFLKLPQIVPSAISEEADYVYMCSNNTIFGTQFKSFPKTGDAPLVCDMSSDILSRPLDISQFGLIFAGAQKNIGPSGVTIVIIRKDLQDRCPDTVPKILQYRNHIKNNSLYNTPPTFGIYMAGLTFKWIEAQGGLGEIEKQNTEKASLLYDAIDNNDFFYCPIPKEDRSAMNVVFRVTDDQEALEKQFVVDAEAAGMTGLKGHRSVGGLRASIYNAQTKDGIKKLIEFMTTFSKKYSHELTGTR